MRRLQDAFEGPPMEDSGAAAGSEASADKESPKVLLALAATFERLVLRNERCLEDLSAHRLLTPFHGLRPPNISISKYLQRIHKYTSCSPSCFVVGFIYIDQLIHKQPDLPLVSLNIHRLLITSIMVATKLLDDVHYNNAFYARVGGIGVPELNSLEIDFLFRLDFRLHVTATIFEGYCTHLERELLLASQQIERTFPSIANSFADQQRNNEKQIMVEEAQKKLRLLMNRSIHSVASAAFSEPSDSPSRWLGL